MKVLPAIFFILWVLSACTVLEGGAVTTTQTLTTENEATTPVSIEKTLTPSAVSTQGEISPLTVEALRLQTTYALSGALDFAYLPESQTILYLTTEKLALMGFQARRLSREISVPGLLFLSSAQHRDVIAWALRTQEIYTLDARAEGEPNLLERAPATLTSLTLSDQGEVLAYATIENKVIVWDLLNRKKALVKDLPFWVAHLAISPQDDVLAGVNPPDFSLYFFDIQSGEELRRLQWTNTASPQLNGAFLSPHWKMIAWVARATVALMQVETEQILATLIHEDYVNAIAWSPDGTLIATASAGEIGGEFTPLVTIWNARDGQALHQLTFRSPVVQVKFNVDGTMLMVLTADGELHQFGIS